MFTCLFMGIPPIGGFWICATLPVLYWVNRRWAREERWTAYLRNECALYIEEVLGVGAA